MMPRIVPHQEDYTDANVQQVRAAVSKYIELYGRFPGVLYVHWDERDAAEEIVQELALLGFMLAVDCCSFPDIRETWCVGERYAVHGVGSFGA